MSRSHVFFSIVAYLFKQVLPSPAQTYNVVDLSELGFQEISKINNRGDIIGSRRGDYGYAYLNGQLLYIGSYLYDINDSGEIVGFGGSEYSAFIFRSGTTTALGNPGGYISRPSGINNLGEIIGKGDASAFIIRDGKATSFSDTNAFLYDINDKGQIVGSRRFPPDPFYQAFLYDQGEIIKIDTLGSLVSFPTEVNNRGEIVGYLQEAGSLFEPAQATPAATPGNERASGNC